MPRHIALVLWLALPVSLSFAKPPSREEVQRQSQVLEELKKSVAVEVTEAEKFAIIKQIMADEPDIDLRGQVLDFATGIPGSLRVSFLTGLLLNDEDAGLRSQAAQALGKTGSEQCLAVLAQVAGSDRTTAMQMGDIRRRSSARRAAIFAMAELAERFPKRADKAAAELRALPIVADPKDNESLADARRQALYQITHDDSLLQPFFDRLKSADANQRQSAIVAFRFLKLKKAPPELVEALQDRDVGVQQWAALVLGEIGDPKSAESLMIAAADTKTDRGVRCNAIGALGQMRTAAAAGLMEKLLLDPDDPIPGNAAGALYRITGKKAKQFQEGYDAN